MRKDNSILRLMNYITHWNDLIDDLVDKILEIAILLKSLKLETTTNNNSPPPDKFIRVKEQCG